MPISVNELFAAANAISSGVVRWGEQVPSTKPGVYCVAKTADPNAPKVDAPSYVPSASAYATLLTARPHLSVDGVRATCASLASRLEQFWIPNEPVLYIGLAGTSMRQRIDQYYATKLGARSPHAGGWWLKTLADHDRLYVHYAACDDVHKAERVMLLHVSAALPRAASRNAGSSRSRRVPSRITAGSGGANGGGAADGGPGGCGWITPSAAPAVMQRSAL